MRHFQRYENLNLEVFECPCWRIQHPNNQNVLFLHFKSCDGCWAANYLVFLFGLLLHILIGRRSGFAPVVQVRIMFTFSPMITAGKIMFRDKYFHDHDQAVASRELCISIRSSIYLFRIPKSSFRAPSSSF